MKTSLRKIEGENVPLVNKLDEIDMAMYRVLLNDRQNAQQMIQQAQSMVLKVQGSEEFLVKFWRDKYNIEGNFEVDNKGNIKRLPTAEAME